MLSAHVNPFFRVSAFHGMSGFECVQRMSPMRAVCENARVNTLILLEPISWDRVGTGEYGVFPPLALASDQRPLAVQ